jgi:hypothetical protein
MKIELCVLVVKYRVVEVMKQKVSSCVRNEIHTQIRRNCVIS